MKFVYKYRTRDNVQRQGEIEAPNRDASFRLLKEKGVRPSWLGDAPGVFNRLFGKGKRWIAIAALAVLAACGWYFAMRFFELEGADARHERRQLVGDLAILGPGLKCGWANILQDEGDRYLAKYIQPGLPIADVAAPTEVVSRIRANLQDVAIAEDELLEHRQVKDILNGMKAELRQYLADGGSVESYLERLADRQRTEEAHYRKAANEIEWASHQLKGENMMRFWKERNESLRNMGIRMVPLPDEFAEQP